MGVCSGVFLATSCWFYAYMEWKLSLSSRSWQNMEPQSFQSYGPCGPYFVWRMSIEQTCVGLGRVAMCRYHMTLGKMNTS
jgi:hypothetical protein